ncbi:copper resistance CopC family protein [Agromyces sp. SYSU T0242]|uniref:copper resistance CopC family protein n=1 Tax=Agromyces litoreus TaxID=3158561 RepID=UPI0033909735
MATARRLPLAAAGAALAVAAAVAGPALPAFAHNTVVAVSPDGEEAVTEQPGTVWLETNDALLVAEGAGAIDVVGPDGRHYATDCASISGAVASVPAQLGPAGEYTVVWRVVSADGHPISGDFAFDWEPADGQPTAEGTDEPACATTGSGEASDDSDAAASADGGSTALAGDLLWIGGGLVVVLAVAAVAFLLVRRPAPTPDAGEVPPTGASPDGGAPAAGRPSDPDGPAADPNGTDGADRA